MDFLTYLCLQQKQHVIPIDLPLYYGVDFSFFSFFFFFSVFLSFSFFFFFESKNYIVEIVPYTIWTVRDKARCRLLYCALLTRYLDIVYIDLLSKKLGGIFPFFFCFLFQKLNRVQPMDGSWGD